MTWNELQEYLRNKVFLVGLTFIDGNGEMIEQYQTHGKLVDLTDEGILRIERKDGSIFQLPYDNENVSAAPEGKYREKTTGDVIINPDYIVSWEITTSNLETIEQAKKEGYVPA